MREKQLERINHKFTTETFKHCHVTAKHVRPVIRLNMPNQLHWEELAIIVVCEAQFIQSVWRSGGRPFVANVNSCSRSLYVVVRPSVVCLSFVVCRL